MTTKITEECINCGACEPECPNVAIYAGAVEYEWQGGKHGALSDDFYYIVAQKCTECVGFFDREACAAACPVDCCIPDPACPESEAVLIARAKVLHPDKEFGVKVPSRFSKSEGTEPSSVQTPVPVVEAAPAAVASVVTTSAIESVPAAAPAIDRVIAALIPATQVSSTAAAPVAEAAAVAAPAAVAVKPAAAVASPVTAAAAKPVAVAVAASAAAASPAAAAPPPRRTVSCSADFEKLKDAVCGSSPKPLSLLARLAGHFGGVRVRGNGSPGFDGFTSTAFESKSERRRRYGEVYRVDELQGGYYIRLELPRKVPPSAAKARLGIGDEMPEYDFEVTLRGPGLTIRGHVVEDDMRALCGVSAAFPPDFNTSIALAGKLAGLGYRYCDRVLEVVVSKGDTASGRVSA